MFSWEGSDYHSHAKMDRKHPGGSREDYREEMYPLGGSRRSPPSSERVFPSMRFSPHQDQEKRHRPPQDQDQIWAEDKRREGFQPHIHNYGNNRRPLPLLKTSLDPPYREMQQGGVKGGRGSIPRSRLSEDDHTHISPPMKKRRGEREGEHQPGFRDEEDFGGRNSSERGSYPMSRLNTGGNGRPAEPLVFDHDHGFPRSNRADMGQRGDYMDHRQEDVDHWEEHVDPRREHVHPRQEHVDPRREHMDHRRDPVDHRWEHVDKQQEHTDMRHGPKTDSMRGGRNAGRGRPRPPEFSQEHSRMWGRQSGERGDARKRPHHDAYQRSPASQRNPTSQDGAEQFGPSGSPMRSRGNSQPLNNRYHSHRGGQGQSQPRYQDRRQQGFRPGPRTFRSQQQQQQQQEEEEEDSSGRTEPQHWHSSRSSSLNQDRNHEPRTQEKRSDWTEPRTKSVAREETLTIRVDASGPARINSPLCYSADRQLSLDLVNVGRQRLDFLPLLEHSGTYRERDGQAGTFAQEIITLVHQVKDQYFRGNSVTLNQRFSAPQNPPGAEKEEEELTLNKRFTANRGFSLDLSSFLEEEDDDDPLFSSPGHLQGLNQQPVRGPGDLRHDLERRRQEKLEGVKVTIAGSLVEQRPVSAARGHDQSSWRHQEEEWWDEPDGMPEGRKEYSRPSYRGRNSRHPPSRPRGPVW